MNLKSLHALVKLAENACDFGIHTQMGIPRSTLWAHINEIEKATGLEIIQRKKQNNVFTEEGKSFLPYAQRLLKLFEEGVGQAKISMSAEPDGEIVIATTYSMANSWIMPSIKSFQEFYPKIKLRVIAGDQIDTATEVLSDILFRPVPEKDFLIKQWSFSYTMGLFASQNYLNKNGIPKTPQDLTSHSMIGYGEHVFSYYPEVDWHLKGRWAGFPKLSPKITINSTLSNYQAAAEDLGICSSPLEANLFYKGQLVRVLPKILGPSVCVNFATKKNASQKLARNVQIFNNFFINYLKNLGVKIEKTLPAAPAA